MIGWDDIATTYGIKRCAACQSGDHHKGWARRSTVHWSDRRMTKAGLRRYLMLVASQLLFDFQNLPTWDRLYRANVWAAKAAKQLHVRIPFRLSEIDRARVRWLISKDPATPDRVKRWATRKER